MRFWRVFVPGLVLVVSALGLAVSAQAATMSGRSSTVFEWYDTGQGETATPVYQYLLFNARDVMADGYNFRLYGRLADDLSDEADEFAESRLYYAYLEKKGFVDGLDFKLGRQFLNTTAGASLMDGLYLDYHNLGPMGIRVFGGGDVSYYENYSAEDLIDGVELYGRFDDLRAELSYVQRWDESELANELFGLNLDYDYADLLNLYTEVQYNYLNDSISYFTAGANYHRVQQYSVRLEYLYSLPVFSSTSIYSVFAVEDYQEILAELTYRFEDHPGLRAFGRYTREIYQDFSDANVFEVGIEKIRTDRYSGYLSGVYRDDDDGQDLAGFKLYGAYLFNEDIRIGAGAHVDTLERRLDDQDDETTSMRLWADATYYLTKKIDVQAKVERTESDLWDDYYRGRVRLNVRF